MLITSLRLQNFRCFSDLKLNFDKKIVLLAGPNGTGKTSVLEALHYACYLRSFKTHITKELINLNDDTDKTFSITATLSSDLDFDILQVGFNKAKRSVKINQSTVSSFKELYTTYKVVTMTEDDLQLVQGGPAVRRSFIDQILALVDASYPHLLKKYHKILINRNALLNNKHRPTSVDIESYNLWTKQLFDCSRLIQKARKEIIAILIEEAKYLIKDVLGYDYTIEIEYLYSSHYNKISTTETCEEFLKLYPNLMDNELRQSRSLFGAHLDDFKISFENKASRVYASRGQQKLVVLLLKLSQIRHINKLSGIHKIVFLLDDFVTDFDESKVANLIPLINSLASQIIITSPLNDSPIYKILNTFESQIININNHN